MKNMTCKRCAKPKPITEFQAKYSDRTYANCEECRKYNSKSYSQKVKNPLIYDHFKAHFGFGQSLYK